MAEALPTEATDQSADSDVVPLVTAAIDFGTTSSGFAFKFDDGTENLQINKWHQGCSDVEKTPTTVLLKEDKTFYSFGYKAEDDYARLCEAQEHKGWRYFHHFKMALYRNEKITRDMQIVDTENKPMAALELLSIVIRYMKDEILKRVHQQKENIEDDDVKYVITVPAIWSDAAKQMMREAATHESVGIRDNRLKLVLEPEAASVYCALRPTEKCKDSGDGQRFQPLPEGSKYIIVDIGGGTVDIATHEIISGHQLHESFIARGCDKGGHYFNERCIDLLKTLFGKECFERWKTTEYDEYLELNKNIERYKRNVSDNEQDLNLTIDESLIELFEETSGENIECFPTRFGEAVRRCNNQTGCIVLRREFLMDILRETVVNIEYYLKRVLGDIPSIKRVYLVGGLANSAFVRQYIETQFPNCSIFVPEDPSVAVLKGAVSLGNCPQIVAGRIARFTYGVAITQEFIPGKHEKEHKFVRDGTVLCRNVFKKLIEKGEVLKFGQKFTAKASVYATQPDTKNKVFGTYLYQSTKRSPLYVTGADCRKLGGFIEPPPDGGWPDSCDSTIEIIVGEAEFKFVVSDDTGRTYKKTIDFLLSAQ